MTSKLNANASIKGTRIVYVSAVAFSLSQLSETISEVCRDGAHVTTIYSKQDLGEKQTKIDSNESLEINIERKISLISDFLSLWHLYRFFKTSNTDIVHSISPKAGLLATLAAKFAGVPIRVHTFTGQVWANEKSYKRFFLKKIDSAIAYCTTKCYADSESQRQFLIQQNVVNRGDIHVIGDGSVAGIDIDRFSIENISTETAESLKNTLNLDDHNKVLIFVGRISVDKGVVELIEALDTIAETGFPFKLLIVGPIDGEVFIDTVDIRDVFKNREYIEWVGYKENVEDYLYLADLLVLPSYREGFGTVVIEAAAMGVPTVGSDIYGLSDSIEDGVTGVLVPKKNTDLLKSAILDLMTDEKHLAVLKSQCVSRVRRKYSSDRMLVLIKSEYTNLLVEMQSRVK